MQDQEITGVWWVPTAPKNKVVGTYVYSKGDGGKLSLFGDLMTEEADLIYGLSEKGNKITLFKNFREKSSQNVALKKSEIVSNFAFIGVYFPSIEHINFKNFSVRFSLLDEWANISGFDINGDFENKEVTIKYKLPANKVLLVTDEYEIFVGVKASTPAIMHVQKEATISQKTHIHVDFSNSTSDYTEVLELIYYIQIFLSLAVSKPVYPLEVTCTSESGKEKHQKIEYYEKINFLYKPSATTNKVEEIMPQYMLFSLGQVFNNVEEILGNWLSKADNLEPVYNLYFSAIYNTSTYTDSRFLNYIQAIESFHRRTCNLTQLSPEEHEKRLTEVIDTVPKQHKEWLTKRLCYSNELTLRDRLKLIFDEFTDVLQPVLNKKLFLNKVINTRNYLTHYDQSLKEKALHGFDLHEINEKLLLILQLCLLSQMGFNKTVIKSLVNENNPLFREIKIKEKLEAVKAKQARKNEP